jgi:hypothetical protein
MGSIERAADAVEVGTLRGAAFVFKLAYQLVE